MRRQDGLMLSYACPVLFFLIPFVLTSKPEVIGSKPVDAELAAYIQANTGGANSPYKWVTPQAGTANPNAGLNTITPAANGCVTAECAAVVGSNRNPIRDSADVRNDVADGAALTSRGAGIVGSTATMAAEMPGPHQPGAAAAAVTATGIGLVSDVVEQLARPNTGQGLVNGTMSVIVDRTTQKIPLLAPVLNEMGEIAKGSTLADQAVNKINTPSK
jgi:hypothetical protein